MFVYVNAHMITTSSTDDNNYSMTVNSRFQGLVLDLQVCLRKKQLDVLWNRENYSFNTTKISHHYGYENMSQKNSVTKRWMKQLMVLVKKYLSDISQFC